MTIQRRQSSQTMNFWQAAAHAVIIFVGSVVLVGWLFNVPALQTAMMGQAPMRANAALCFVLFGIALWMLRAESPSPRRQQVAQFAVALIFIIGFLTLVEHITGWNIGIDELLLRNAGPRAETPFGIRMPPAAAFCFVVLASALWFCSRRQHPTAAQVLALAVMELALFSLAGYLYGIAALYDSFLFGSIALSAAFTFVMSAIGILLIAPQHGWMAVVSAPNSGGIAARRLLPAAVLVPFVIGWLYFRGQQMGLFGAELGLALFALSNVTIFALLIWWNARLLNRLDAERQQAAGRISNLNRTLSVLSDINQAIVRVREIPRLFETACEVAVRVGGFRAAWIGLIDAETQKFTLAAHWGIPDDYLVLLRRSMETEPAEDTGEELSFVALARSGKRRIINDIQAEPSLPPERRKEAQSIGYHSVALTPLIVAGKPRGIIAFYVEERGFFDTAELRLLDEMAGDIGFAMEFAGKEAQRRQAEEALREMNETLEQRIVERTVELSRAKEQVEAILNNSTDGILLADTHLGIRRTNPAFDRLFGCDAEAALNCSLSTFIHPDDEAQMTALIQTVVDERTARNVDMRGVRADQSAFDASFSIGYFTAERGDEGVVCMIQDITERKREQTALAEERNLLRTLIDTTPDYIFIKDMQHRLVLTNLAHARAHGKTSPDEMIGTTDMDYFPPEMANQFCAEEEAVLRTGQPMLDFEQPARSEHGGLTWASSNKVPLRNLRGEMVGLVGIIRDISERKRTEEALRESEHKFRSLVNAAPLATIITDDQGLITLINDQCEKLFGYTGAELQGQQVDILVPENRRDRQKQYRANFVAASSVRSLGQNRELTGRRKDGSEFPVEMELSHVETESGILILAFVIDITERKRAEEELLHQRDFLQLVVDNVPSLIIVKDRDLRFSLANSHMAHLFGVAPADMIGKVDADFNTDPVQLALSARKDHEALASGQPVFIPEEPLLDRLYETSKIPLRQPDGSVDRLLVVATDITERKKAEEALQRAFKQEKELGDLKSRFVSMASHEFRTPLATILASAETLSVYRPRMTEAQIDTRINNIREQVDHLKNIIEDVLQLARIQAGRIEFNPTLIHLDALCQSVIDEFRSRSDVPHQLVYHCNPASREAHLDRKLMRQIINNLVSNAVKYSTSEKPIDVSLEFTDTSVILSVRDWGIGIPEADMSRLFEPFHRATNVGTISGTGLGLSITKEAVELHGGTIDVDSQVGVGTTFIVTIPLSAQPKDTHDEDPGH